MRAKIHIMRLMLLFSTVLLGVKFGAWWITHSNAILTDALESIVNVAAGAFALFSIIYAARPKDDDHPYGHGKIEFISAGFEGALILLAGGGILYKSFLAFRYPHELHQLDWGIGLTLVSGLCNFVMGRYLIARGQLEASMLMVANGKHLVTDTISSVGLVAGLILIHYTGLTWLDNVLAIAFALVIIFTGIQIVREATSGLLDEADKNKLEQVIEILQKNRREQWIDMHKLRVQRYGFNLHIDAHITLPWYLSLEEAHAEVNALSELVNTSMGEEVESFIHADPCIEISCPVCAVEQCPHRRQPLKRIIEWKPENVLPDKKHQLDTL